MAAVGPSCGPAPRVNPVVRKGWFWSILRCGVKGIHRSRVSPTIPLKLKIGPQHDRLGFWFNSDLGHRVAPQRPVSGQGTSAPASGSWLGRVFDVAVPSARLFPFVSGSVGTENTARFLDRSRMRSWTVDVRVS